MTNLPPDDAGRLALLQHFAATLPRYAESLGLSHDELAQASSAAAWFKFALDFDNAAQAYAQGAVAFKISVRDGQKFGVLTLPSLSLPSPPASQPFADAAGLLSALIVRIRLHPRYCEAMGEALNLPPLDVATMDLDSVQPKLAVEILGGHPNIHWKKHGMDALEIEVDRGEGAFSPLAIDPVPDLLDIAPLPSPGASALWRYRAIYRCKDQRVGYWSEVLEVEVKGCLL